MPHPPSLRGLFITGTDTNVGKTVVAAALVDCCRTRTPVRYWKPIQTGSGRDDDTAEVVRLAGCTPDEVLDEGVRLPHPVSPHLAAARQGSTIDLGPLIAAAHAADDGRYWIVEGAGGVLVPINETRLMIDLMAALGLPAVVVARSTLGTINHTLLTVECLRRRDIAVAGVVMVGPRDPDNRAAIERHGGVSILGEMPRFEPLTPEAVGAWATRALRDLARA